MVFSLLTILSVLSFIYAIWVILRQKQVTDLLKRDPRMNKYVGIIKDQNSRLNNQVEKVLNIARLEKDQFKLNKETLHLQNTITTICDQEKIKFENADGMIDTRFQDQALYIEADKLHLTNVVSNILDNALKYCKEKPSVIVSIEEENSKAVLKVKDNGIGIEKENLKQIFNKFYRISTGNVHNVKGFGLGLFYVKNICDAHGWEININSKINHGTTIEIRFSLTSKEIANE